MKRFFTVLAAKTKWTALLQYNEALWDSIKLYEVPVDFTVKYLTLVYNQTCQGCLEKQVINACATLLSCVS